MLLQGWEILSFRGENESHGTYVSISKRLIDLLEFTFRNHKKCSGVLTDKKIEHRTNTIYHTYDRSFISE